MNQHTGQPTLRDLVRPIAAHKWLLLAVVVLAVGASIGYSASRKKTYAASASIAVHDESRDLSLVGLPLTPAQTADQLASAAAQTIVQSSVAKHVQHVLRTREPLSALTSSVTATVQASSNLVTVTAHARTAAMARDLANDFAAQGARALNSQQRQAYARAARDLKKHTPKPTGKPSPAAIVAAQELYNEQLSRLQVLSTIAAPAQVVTNASLPKSPASPRPVRDALLAAAFGLVLGLLIVYVRESFDRRLRTVHDVEQELRFPMLGHVRHDALGRSPRLNGNQGASAIDWELFRIMRRNLDFLDDREQARIVAVTSPLPEEGKSTVAAFLAFVSAAAGKRTLLVECDMRRPVFADRLQLKKAPGLSDFLAGQATPDKILQVIKFGDPISVNGHAPAAHGAGKGDPALAGATDRPEPHAHELVCITSGSATRHPVELMRTDLMRRMLAEVGEAYDLVILDTPPMLSVVDTLELLPEVDAALVCIRAHQTTRQQARAGVAALARLPERPTGVVITGTHPSRDSEYSYYGYYS